MKSIIVFDLDNTLRDGSHRSHLVPTENLDRTESWDAFNLACGDDTPIADNIALLTDLAATYSIIILSSCCEVARDITTDWLREHHVWCDTLIMRRADDHRTMMEFKEAELREIGLEHILCCFDDDPKVVRHIRSLGLTCHEVRHYDSAE